MKYLLYSFFLFMSSVSWASNTENPIEFSEKVTGYACEEAGRNDSYYEVVCKSEQYLDDGIQCDYNGICDPVYDIPTVNICNLTFKKLDANQYQLLDKQCEKERVEQ